MQAKIIITCDTELYNDLLLCKSVLSPLKSLAALTREFNVPINIFLAPYDYVSRDYNEPFIHSWHRIKEIINSNQFSVQLHLHARGIVGNGDNFGELSPPEKDYAIKFAKNQIKTLFGKKPFAFRAGGYNIGRDILDSFKVLASNNIKYDFSIAPNKVRSRAANFRNVDLEYLRKESDIIPVPLPTNRNGKIISCERCSETVVYEAISRCNDEYFVLDFHSFFVHQSSGKRPIAALELMINHVLTKLNHHFSTKIYFQSKAFFDFKILLRRLVNENYTFVNLDDL